VDDTREYKDNICSAKKIQLKFGVWCPETILSCQYSQNIKILKNNHLETQINARNNKRENLSIKIAAA
jgi:hypothetical protein